MSANSNLPVGLAEMVPGPALVAALSVVDVAGLSAHELVIVAAAWERQAAFDAAQQADVLAALANAAEYAECTFPENAEATHQHDPVQPAADEASLAMRWSPGHAKGRVRVAVELVTICTATLDALRAGLIDSYKAKLICDRTRVLADADARRWVEARVLRTAATKTSRQLDERLRAAVIAADPAAAEERRVNASTQRRVNRPEPADAGGADGMARMSLEGPAEDLLALFTAVDAAARHARANGDARTLDQLRFDVLAGLGWTGLDLGHLGCCNPACQPNGASSHPFGHAHGRAAAVHVTVPYTVFQHARTATSDASANIPDGPAAPYLLGFGPVTPGAARRVATEGTLRRLITDDADGRLLEYGRSTYTRPRSWPTTSSPGTPPVAFRHATRPPGRATSTTSIPGTTAVLPVRRTPGRCTTATISARRTMVSGSTPTPPALPGGSRRRATAIESIPRRSVRSSDRRLPEWLATCLRADAHAARGPRR